MREKIILNAYKAALSLALNCQMPLSIKFHLSKACKKSSNLARKFDKTVSWIEFINTVPISYNNLLKKSLFLFSLAKPNQISEIVNWFLSKSIIKNNSIIFKYRDGFVTKNETWYYCLPLIKIRIFQIKNCPNFHCKLLILKSNKNCKKLNKVRPDSILLYSKGKCLSHSII